MMIGGNKMLCDDCKKNSACVHLTQIMNGEKVDKQLCEHCAQKYGELVFTNSNNFSVNDFLHSLFSNNSPASQQQQSRVCENCGMSYSDFTAGGKLGCSECYKYFDKKLVPLISVYYLFSQSYYISDDIMVFHNSDIYACIDIIRYIIL